MIQKVIAKRAASDPFAIALSIVFIDLSSGCKFMAISTAVLSRRPVEIRSTPPDLDRAFEYLPNRRD